MNIAKFIKNLRFKLKTAEYMRVAYLSPRKVVMVTTRLGNADNVLPIDWHIPISFEPKLYAVCLESHNYSAGTIRQTGQFVVNFVSAALEEKILLCGRISGKAGDKFELSGLTKKDAHRVNAAVLTEAFGHLECRVTDIREWGDHTVFVGEVVYEHLGNINPEELYHITKLPQP